MKAFKKTMLEFSKVESSKVFRAGMLPTDPETCALALEFVQTCGSFSKIRDRAARKGKKIGSKEAMEVRCLGPEMQWYVVHEKHRDGPAFHLARCASCSCHPSQVAGDMSLAHAGNAKQCNTHSLERLQIVARRLKSWGTPHVIGYVSGFDQLRELDWPTVLRTALMNKRQEHLARKGQHESARQDAQPESAGSEAAASSDEDGGAASAASGSGESGSDDDVASDAEHGEASDGERVSGFVAEAPPELGGEDADGTDADEVAAAFRELMGGELPRAYSEYR